MHSLFHRFLCPRFLFKRFILYFNASYVNVSYFNASNLSVWNRTGFHTAYFNVSYFNASYFNGLSLISTVVISTVLISLVWERHIKRIVLTGALPLSRMGKNMVNVMHDSLLGVVSPRSGSPKLPDGPGKNVFRYGWIPDVVFLTVSAAEMRYDTS